MPPLVALVLGDASAGIKRGLELSLACGDTHVLARLTREELEPPAVALLEVVSGSGRQPCGRCAGCFLLDR